MTDEDVTGKSQEHDEPGEDLDVLLTPSISSPTPPPVPEAAPLPVPTEMDGGSQPEGQAISPSGPNPEAMNKAKGYLLKIGKLMIFLTIIGSCLLLFGAYLISSTIDRIINQYTPQ